MYYFKVEVPAPLPANLIASSVVNTLQPIPVSAEVNSLATQATSSSAQNIAQNLQKSEDFQTIITTSKIPVNIMETSSSISVPRTSLQATSSTPTISSSIPKEPATLGPASADGVEIVAFCSGNPQVEVTRGKLHLYRERLPTRGVVGGADSAAASASSSSSINASNTGPPPPGILPHRRSDMIAMVIFCFQLHYLFN